MALFWSSAVSGNALLPLSMIKTLVFVVLPKIAGMDTTAPTNCRVINFVADA